MTKHFLKTDVELKQQQQQNGATPENTEIKTNRSTSFSTLDTYTKNIFTSHTTEYNDNIVFRGVFFLYEKDL